MSQTQKSQFSSKDVQQITDYIKLGLFVVPVIIVVGIMGWIIYSASVQVLQIVALCTSAGLPVALALGWYARGMLADERSAGRDEALHQVLPTATNVADLRTTAVGAVRQTLNTTFSPQAQMALPEQMFVVPGKAEAGEIIDV